MNKILKDFIRFLLYLLLTLLPIIAYIYLYNIFMDKSNVYTYQQGYLELTILIMILYILYIPQKNIFKNAFLSIIPILSLYIAYDIFYYFLKRSARLSDFSNIILLNDFSFLLLLGFIFFVCATLIPIFLILLSHKNKLYKNKILNISKVLLIITVFILLASPNNYLIKHFNYMNWSEGRTIAYNGRFSSFIYYDSTSHMAKKKLLKYKDIKIDIDKSLFPASKITEKRNIYLIVLESFIDPRLLKDISYNRSPLSSKLKKYLGKEGFSHPESPVYGGGTAQAEFELLTGIPALAKIKSIEFNTLEGEKMSSFVNSLQKEGYQSYASIATNSEYFNSILAYKSIGLKHLQFLEETDAYVPRKGDVHIFDGDLFDYNLKRIKSFSKNKPYIFYTLGMYGHIPYERNTALRPSVIHPSIDDYQIEHIVNQFYYRTKALGEYIDKILAQDPHCIIYVSSDHLPAILSDKIKYIKYQTVNISLLLIDGKNVPLPRALRYYKIPRYLWHYLHNNDNNLSFKDTHTAEEEKKIYFKALSESLKKE